MNIVDRLASSMDRKDEAANIALAEDICNKNDAKAVAELRRLLEEGSQALQSDCIKVLYEIGERNPELIRPYVQVFISLLESKNNRLQWGAMHALDTVTVLEPKQVYAALSRILEVADKGSVITRDHAFNILIALCSVKSYASKMYPLMREQLLSCPPNQVPMYAERALEVVPAGEAQAFSEILTARLDDMEKESKRKRVLKVILALGLMK